MGTMLTKEPTIHENARINDSDLGLWIEIGKNNSLDNTIVGDFSYTGKDCMFQNVKIGKFANIAAAVRIGATDHPMTRATLHHFTYRKRMYGFSDKDDETFFEDRARRVTTIGHDTWIGHGALIKPGLTIGHGSVIGQGSVVTKNIPDYAIVAGNPAKIVRYRFEEEIIQKLLSIKWWDWSYETIKARSEDFSLPIELFLNKYTHHGRENG